MCLSCRSTCHVFGTAVFVAPPWRVTLGRQRICNHEEAECFIFFDELVPEINNDQSSRTDYLSEVGMIVDIFGCEIQSLMGQLLEVIR
jgi:hypothetical protein